MTFKRLNTITGWLAGIIATIVYFLTLEPTVSWWDCGEYISTAYKLQVGHPPGAPLFQMIGRFFSLFAGGDVTKVAMMVNVMSAICSGLTIVFLFWVYRGLDEIRSALMHRKGRDFIRYGWHMVRGAFAGLSMH